jgi:hypothetical protein
MLTGTLPACNVEFRGPVAIVNVWEPFAASVARICEKFSLPSGIVRPSRLLSGHEELLGRLLL